MDKEKKEPKMSKQEFAVLISAIKTAYPKEKLFQLSESLSIWYELLKDIPYPMASAVLQQWIATNRWSPTIADIREQAVKLALGKCKDWGEAWEDVMRAIRRYGRNCEDEAMATLDETTRKALKRVGYRAICNSQEEELGVQRASFRDIYNIEADRRLEIAKTPERVRELIDKSFKTIESDDIFYLNQKEEEG